MQASHAYFVRLYHQLDEIGIHPGQLPLLRLLDIQDGLSQKEIASRLSLSAPTVTMSIRRLEKNGLVSRQQDQRDQRVSRIYLTDLGESCAAQIEKILVQNEKVLQRGFNEAELCLLKRFCEQLRENIQQSEGGNR